MTTRTTTRRRSPEPTVPTWWRSGGPPAGWLGKPWACQRGTEVATGQHLVFLDADVRLAPDALGRLLATQAEIAPDGLLSVQPFHEVEQPYESLSAISNLVTVLASGIGVPGERSSDLAFGPCLVTTPEALASAGGWAAVRGRSWRTWPWPAPTAPPAARCVAWPEAARCASACTPTGSAR